MDFTGLVWKRVLKITLFGLKSGQDFKNRAAHPHQEFAGVPPGDTSLFSQGVKSFTYLRTKTGTHQYDRLLTKDIHPKCLSFSRANYHWRVQNFFSVCRGGSRGRVQGVRPPPPEMTCGFLIQLVFCKRKKTYVIYWCWSRARDECTPS